jgi:hypothetical protein
MCWHSLPQAFCDASPACTGYTYAASAGFCGVYGPGLDTDLAGGMSAWHRSATTTIGGATGDSESVCAAVAGRN